MPSFNYLTKPVSIKQTKFNVLNIINNFRNVSLSSFYTSNSIPVPFDNMFRNRSAFLILGGPSFATLDSKKLLDPNVLVFGVNNSVKSFRPNVWISADPPANFITSVWQDAKIMKFIPIEHIKSPIINSYTKEVDVESSTKEYPNVWYFKKNELFNPETFLSELSFNWGNAPKDGGVRSIMQIALKVMYKLGIRKVFLLGCDFKMNADYTYHFQQNRHESSVKNNTKTYQVLAERFALLKPIFDIAGFEVYNCNPDSELKVFPYLSYEDAINTTQRDIIDWKNEPTEGLYDREYRLRVAEKERIKNARNKQG